MFRRANVVSLAASCLFMASVACTFGSQSVELPTPTVSAPTQSLAIVVATDTPTQTTTPILISTSAPNSASDQPSCSPRTDWPIYSVLSGDTLGSIAQRSNSTADALAAANCLSNANNIHTGQQLRVPQQPAPPTIPNVPAPTTTYCSDQPGKSDVLFPANTTSATVTNLLSPRAADTWIVHGLAGQKLSLQLMSSTGKAYLIVSGANRTLLLSGDTQAITFSGILPATQDYYIIVNSNSLVCSNYTLTASLDIPSTIPNMPPPTTTYCSDQPGKTDFLFSANTTSATVTNLLSPRAADTWIVHGLAGQKLSLQLISSTGKAYLIVSGANRTLLLSGDTQAITFSGILPATQDYYIIVNSNSLVCSNYTLTAGLTG